MEEATNPKLSRQRVVTAGLAVARSGRPVSMRAIAHELGVSTMAAYRHVHGREDVDASMLNAVLGEVTPEADWKLENLALATMTRLREYPGLERHLTTDLLADPFDGYPNVVVWREAVASRLRRPDLLPAVVWAVRGAAAERDRWHDSASSLLAVCEGLSC